MKEPPAATGAAVDPEGMDGVDEGQAPDVDGEPELASRPNAWLVQFKAGSHVTRSLSRAVPGATVPWKFGKLVAADVDAMQPGDPIVYWRSITKGRDRGGVVGTGRLASLERVVDESGAERLPTVIDEFYDEAPLSRDAVIEATGLQPGHWQFSMYRLPPDVAERMDAHLRANGRSGLFGEIPPSHHRTDLRVLADRPETGVDHLGRADLALLLAIKLNQAWDAACETGREDTSRPAASTPSPGPIGWWRRWRADRRPPTLADGGLVVHVDAPWGGGKSSFANYLATILNPYAHRGELPRWPAMRKLCDAKFWGEYARPWLVVQFNAWQVQHMDPPWWCFYQTIRKQAFQAMLWEINRQQGATSGREGDGGLCRPQPEFGYDSGPARVWRWARAGMAEIAWRLLTPKNIVLAVVSALALAVAYYGAKHDWLASTGKLEARIAMVAAVATGGLSFVWGAFNTLTASLVPGTPDAARNYSLGGGDPLDRFRRHFERLLRRVHRPVLVVIDDLDRCEPRFVVELFRGIQTVLRSPRVVFLILGNRDWIENAFAHQHAAMKGIDVGPEHSFGGRFVEKAIQLSLVLPDLRDDDRTGFVRHLLIPGDAPATAGTGTSPTDAKLAGDLLAQSGELVDLREVGEREARTRSLVAKAGAIADTDTRQQVVQQMNREAALVSARDRDVEGAIGHLLVPLAPVLPANPRQIKRIINAVALFQEIGRLQAGIQPGSDQWRQLVQWVVLMTEYPQTWFTLSRYPGIADRVLGIASPEGSAEFPDEIRAAHWAAQIGSQRAVARLLAFDGWAEGKAPIRLDSATIVTLRAVMPAASGTLLPRPD